MRGSPHYLYRSKTIAFPCTRRNERRRLPNDRVSCPHCIARKKVPCSPATHLLIRGKDEAQSLLQLLCLDPPYRRQHTRKKALHIASPTSMKHPIFFVKFCCPNPLRAKRNSVGVTHNRKFRIDLSIAHRLRRHNKIQLLHASRILIPEHSMMPPKRFEDPLKPFQNRPVAHAGGRLK